MTKISEGSLNPEMIFHKASDSNNSPLSDVMKSAVVANGIESVAFNSAVPKSLLNNFSHEVKSGKITSQEKSGRCWMFAGLNLFRSRIVKGLNLDDFEFSQNYPMFFDKLEKANYFLESILRTLDEDIYSRILMHLLSDPIQDGGQWDMFANLIQKYGAVPKTVMPETFHSNNSAVMNQLLTAKLRQWASEIRSKHQNGSSMSELRSAKEKYIAEFFQLLTYFLGDPPTVFTYEFYDKSGTHQTLEALSPQKFFQDYVKVDLSEYVSLIHAPTPDKPFGQTFSVDYLGNVWEGNPVLYLNVELKELKEVTISQLQAGEPVWFGCDVRLQTHKKKGLMDSRVFLFDHTLSTDFNLNKTDRLLYGDSLLTHAMVFTGVHLRDKVPQRWKVENSWGEDRGEKGFFIMSDTWFDEYNYQVVVRKEFLTPGMREQLAQDPVILPPWDPMGSLAKIR
jgi:bleomycin hydrolase